MCDDHSHSACTPSKGSAAAVADDPSEHPLLNTLTISERTIHKTCWKAHRLGHAARLRFIRALAAARETGLYVKLGFPTVHHYAKDQFQCEDSQAREFLRVARLLPKLPLMTWEFQEGRLSWSAFEVMSRVAKRGKEKEWLEFAKGKSMAQIKDEVHRAIEEGRRRPRKDGFSLRNRTIRVVFNLTLEEHDRLLKAFLKLARELAPAFRGRLIEPKHLLLFLVQRLLETDPAGTPQGRVEREESLCTFLYHLCRSCGSKHLMTRDGPVEVPQEVIDRVKGSAHCVEISPEEEWEIIVDDVLTPVIDNPNTAALARKVRLRDGACCANCKRKVGLHAHHIRFRARGGRTVLANECCVCVSCHTLLHLGLLKVSGNPVDGITFHTVADDLTGEFSREAEEKMTSVPVCIVPPAPADSGRPEPGANSEEKAQASSVDTSDTAHRSVPTDSSRTSTYDTGRPVPVDKSQTSASKITRPAGENEAVEMTRAALRSLGFTASEARERAQRARETLLEGGRAVLTVSDCSALLREAFRSRWSKGLELPPDP